MFLYMYVWCLSVVCIEEHLNVCMYVCMYVGQFVSFHYSMYYKANPDAPLDLIDSTHFNPDDGPFLQKHGLPQPNLNICWLTWIYIFVLMHTIHTYIYLFRNRLMYTYIHTLSYIIHTYSAYVHRYISRYIGQYIHE